MSGSNAGVPPARILPFPEAVAKKRPLPDRLVWLRIAQKLEAISATRPDLVDILAKAVEQIVDRWLAGDADDGLPGPQPAEHFGTIGTRQNV